ncbi:putative transcriptional elongation regulator [Papiliotrema laurentii]|uniref:Peptidyl-prolyl cis-trans isomerase n=1 Tax=Papiliotrema laurentii TaxID=5418 RepID=A0AAD9FV83_PAPLA|nr:putative transcriptional elongation regulator [Papiliotrema laurentii]
MSGWEVRFSKSRQMPYFYNPGTSESVWDPPAGLSPDQIARLPGAAQYLQGGQGGQAQGGAGGRAGEVRASHILVKHAGSRRPSSWRTPNITRPLAEARQRIQQIIDHLQSVPQQDLPREFARIAAEESDCSSAKKGGDLGWFGAGAMQKSFEEATFALQPGQLSPVVESDSGVHVILRTG